jgi:hypothetical protein
MPTFVSMSSKEIVTKYPEMADAVACVTPFLKLFDEAGLCIRDDGQCIWLSSTLHLPWVPADIERWEALIYATRAQVIGYKRFLGDTWQGGYGERLTLDEFGDFLLRVREHRGARISQKGATRKPAKGTVVRRVLSQGTTRQET